MAARKATVESRERGMTVSLAESPNVAGILQEMSLNLTSDFCGEDHHIDLLEHDVPSVLRDLARQASRSSQTLFTFDRNLGRWCDIRRARLGPLCRAGDMGGSIEIAIVSDDTRLLSRYSITVWREGEKFLEARHNYAPIKRVKKSAGPYAKQRKHDLQKTPVDVVFTWVNSLDPVWRSSFEQYSDLCGADSDRFDQSEELRYAIRALVQFAPWVRRIFILSNCAPPPWYRPNETVIWIPHEAVIPSEYLPTFNSHAIETYLHHIPNIAENFIYLNDDFFISDFVNKKDFHTDFGSTVCRLEPYGALQYLEELCFAEEAEEWQHAAVNGVNLINEKFGFRPRQLHRHAPYAFKKSVFLEIEEQFPNEFHATRSARMRSRGDVSIASFVYHHYALATRRAVETNDESMIVRHTNYARFEKRKLYKQMKFFCVNDGGGSGHHVGYKRFKHTFLPKLYPFKSCAEI